MNPTLLACLSLILVSCGAPVTDGSSLVQPNADVPDGVCCRVERKRYTTVEQTDYWIDYRTLGLADDDCVSMERDELKVNINGEVYWVTSDTAPPSSCGK